MGWPDAYDQRYSSRTGLAALNVLLGEAAPAPLVLQLVKAVLAVRSIPVELAKGLQWIVAFSRFTARIVRKTLFNL
jgi:hypothetical protein